MSRTMAGILMVVLLGAGATVVSAGYVDEFTTDTSANYSMGIFEQSANIPPTLTWGPTELQVQVNGGISYKMMLANGETLDVGEYVQVTVSAAAGGMHWRNVGLLVSSTSDPSVNSGGSVNGNGFLFVFDPQLDNRATKEFHIDGFGTFGSPEGICDMAPTPANVYTSGTLTGDTHTLRIEKKTGQMDFYVDDLANPVWTYSGDVSGLSVAGMHYANWSTSLLSADTIDDFVIAPEPGTMVLLLAGGAVGLLKRRK